VAARRCSGSAPVQCAAAPSFAFDTKSHSIASTAPTQHNQASYLNGTTLNGPCVAARHKGHDATEPYVVSLVQRETSSCSTRSQTRSPPLRPHIMRVIWQTICNGGANTRSAMRVQGSPRSLAREDRNGRPPASGRERALT